MHRFEFTDPDGDRLTVQPLTRADGTHVLDMTSTEQGKDTLHRASVFVPLDRVEEVIAGMRSAARSAGHAPGTVTVRLVVPEGDKLAAVVRAAVRPGPVVPAPRAHRVLTEHEHDRAWHAIEGLDWDAGPDPDTVLNAVLRALDIAPPEPRSDQ